jgi:hypothetical protein
MGFVGLPLIGFGRTSDKRLLRKVLDGFRVGDIPSYQGGKERILRTYSALSASA